MNKLLQDCKGKRVNVYFKKLDHRVESVMEIIDIYKNFVKVKRLRYPNQKNSPYGYALININDISYIELDENWIDPSKE